MHLRLGANCQKYNHVNNKVSRPHIQYSLAQNHVWSSGQLCIIGKIKILCWKEKNIEALYDKKY
jgi:hypothetical protein